MTRTKPPKPQFPMVLVEWLDSCEPSPNSEVDFAEIPEPQKIFQCGFLVRETDESVSVAGAWKPECRSFDYVITIPKFAVQSMHKIHK
tara:strand:+ start:215 stop:478 length:264 start_codon:yes stop_codon:yes gene_type:complete